MSTITGIPRAARNATVLLKLVVLVIVVMSNPFLKKSWTNWVFVSELQAGHSALHEGEYGHDQE